MKFIYFIAFTLTLTSCSHSAKKEEPVTSAPAQGNPTSVSQKSECKLGSDARTVDIRPGASSGCETHYTKDGKDEISAQAKWDLSYCQKIYSIIKTKLEDAGYNCQESKN